MEKFKIGVFCSANNKWTLLPETSAILSDKNIIPVIGDRVTTVGDDFKLMKLQQGDFKSVVTVTERLHGYVNCELALICEYKEW